MSGIMKAALVTWMLKHKCKIEKVEAPGERDAWWVVFECPNSIGGTFRNFGSGSSECGALIDAMRRAGVYNLKARLFILEFMVEHVANRAAPVLLRRIENAARS